MAQNAAIKGGKYRNQRPTTPPPVFYMGAVRKRLGLTLQDVCDHINNDGLFSKPVERGTISAIENGHRGASTQMLAAIVDALGLHVSDVDTSYEPRARRVEVA